MKVLIPGGFGFLGGRLGQFLAAGGAEVVLGSRHMHAPPQWLPGATVIRTPWESEAELGKICAGVECIVHLAGMNAQDCAADPVGAFEFNALATARLVVAALQKGVRRFVYVSTAHVYGSPLSGAITESTSTLGSHPYATSHRAAEEAVLGVAQAGKIEALVIRLSNAFGAPAHADADCWTLVFNDLCRQAVTTRRMVLRSSGLQRRDFIPVQEACRAMDHLLRVDRDRVPSGIVNVGGGESISVWDAACLVRDRCEAVMGYRPALERAEPQVGETAADLDYRLDALRQSGFEPGGDRVGEIDRLLRFCAEAFAPLAQR